MRFSPKKLLTSVGAGATFSLFYAQSAMAATTSVGDIGNIESVPIIQSTSGNDLYVIIGNIVNIILIVVGILAVVYLVYGGILYLTAGGDAEKAGKGRVAITNAIIGIVIIMLSLAIYNFVINQVK